MRHWRHLAVRLWQSPVVWSWGFNGLRLGTGVLLLPLLLRLPSSDFGFYYVFLSLSALVPLLDLGFLTSIDRAISSAMSGTKSLQVEGVADRAPGQVVAPNYDLLWKLLDATRRLYRILSVGVLLLLGAWGSYVVGIGVEESSHPTLTWLAWGLTLAGGVIEMYSGWWNVYLRGLNQVLLCSRILALAFALKFLISIGLLLSGAGLLSVPIASFVSSFLQRHLSRHYSLRFLEGHTCPIIPRAEVISLIKTLWPNSWKTGLYYFSGYIVTSGNTFLCLKFLGPSANATYGLSMHLVAICSTMATVWVQVKWPRAYQMLASGDLDALRGMIQPRFRLMIVTYSFASMVAMLLGPYGLSLLQEAGWTSHKAIVTQPWLLLLFITGLLELHLTFWGMIIIAGNRLPFLWPSVVTNTLSLLAAIVMLQFTSLGMGALVLAPLLCGSTFNYWWWAGEGSRVLKTRWHSFVIGGGWQRR
jgi:O-antigen/teichoic acid export membrane protein